MRSNSRRRSRKELAASGVGSMTGCSCGDPDAQITVLAASSLRAPFAQIAEEFQRDNPGTTVRFNFAGSSDLVAQLQQGAPGDVLATADEPTMAMATAEGLTASPTVFATNTMTIVVPIDNPATHLELTMIHEALILEYSGRHLALLEWAASLKLFAYSCIGLALFFPWGVAEAQAPLALLLAMPALVLKLAIGGALLALLETLSAKMRIFRAPEFLATAFLLAVIGMLVHILVRP